VSIYGNPPSLSLLPGAAKAAAKALDSVKGDLTMRLKQLTNRAPIVVFMKGHPSAAKCKFSKQVDLPSTPTSLAMLPPISCILTLFTSISLQVVALLAEHGVVYDSFDILQGFNAVLTLF